MGRATSRRQTGSGQGLPGWAMLTIGLIIGLFVAFLVYLDDLEQPPSAAVESGGEGDRSVAGDEDTGTAEDRPKFEFYSILPDLEVIVPDAPPPEDADPEADASISTETDPDGTYFLQVGSFQESDQADRMKAEISLLGLDVDIQTVTVSGQRWHRVRIGPYSDPGKLGAAQRRLRENDIDYLVLREKSPN